MDKPDLQQLKLILLLILDNDRNNFLFPLIRQPYTIITTSPIIQTLLHRTHTQYQLLDSNQTSFQYHQYLSHALNHFIKDNYKIDYLNLDQNEALLYCILKDSSDYLLNQCQKRLNYEARTVLAYFMDYVEFRTVDRQTSHSFWNSSYIKMTRSIINCRYLSQKHQIQQYEVEKQNMDDQYHQIYNQFIGWDQQIYIMQTILEQFQCESLQELESKFRTIQDHNRKLVYEQNIRNQQFSKEHQYYEQRELELNGLKSQFQKLNLKYHSMVEQSAKDKDKIEDYEQRCSNLNQKVQQISRKLQIQSQNVQSHKNQRVYLIGVKTKLEQDLEKYQKQIQQLELELYEKNQKIDRMSKQQSGQKAVCFEKSYTNDYCKTLQSGQFMLDFQDSIKQNWMTSKKVVLKEEDEQKNTVNQIKVRDEIMSQLVKDVVEFKL